MHPMLNIGIRAARAAGDMIARTMDQAGDVTVTEKSLNDYVSAVDRRAEEIIIETIRKVYPDHAILAEESGRQAGAAYEWVIDPLDGTTNFLHGFPHFAVSIALRHEGQLEQAVIYDPVRQELFTASRGAGAKLNNRRIRVSKRRHLKGALLGTGFPFGNNPALDQFISSLRTLFPEVAGIRRAGAASLDLAYVACGRLDGFWEFGLKPWDMAAGALLIIEAGGYVTDMDGNDDYLDKGTILTANAQLYELMREAMRTNA